MSEPEVKVKITGDDADLKGKLSNSLGSIKSFATGALGALSALAATGAAKLLGDFFKSSIEEAAKAETGYARLGVALKNVGVDLGSVKPEIEGVISSLVKMTTFTDDDFRAALTNMVTISGDAKGSLNNLGLAADVAAYKQIGLEQASTLVGKAMTGNAKALREFGIDAKNVADPIQALRDKVGGFAEAEGKTFAGTLTRIKNGFGEFQEAVGAALLGTGEFTKGGNVLVDLLASLEKWVGENGNAIGVFVSAVVDVGGAIFDAIRAGFRPMVDILGGPLKLAFVGLVATLDFVAASLRLVSASGQLFTGKFLEALGTLAEKGGKILRLFGIEVSDTFGKSLRESGEAMVADAKKNAQAATATFSANITKLQGLQKGHSAATEAEDKRHTSALVGEANKRGTALTAEQQKALKKQQDDLEKFQALEVATNKKTAADVLKIRDALRDGISKQSKEAEANAKALAEQLEKAFGPVVQGMAAATTQQVKQMLAQLAEATKQKYYPIEKWQALNEKGRVYINTLEDMLPPIDEMTKGVKRTQEEVDKLNKKHERQRETVVAIARGALEIVDAFGLVSDETAKVLNDVVNIAEALPKALKGDIGSIVQVLGSLANLIVGIGDSAQEKKRLDASDRNTRAIEKLTAEVGNLNLSASGKKFAGVQEAVDAAIAAFEKSKAAGGKETAFRAGEAAFDAALAKAGITKAEANDLFKELTGGDIARANKQGFIESILAFRKALGAAEFGQFGQDFEGQKQFTEDRLRARGTESDPFAQIEAFSTLFAKFSPLLSGVVGDLGSLNTKGGRDTAIQQLLSLFDQLNTGAFKDRAAEVGISGDQFRDAILQLIDLLRGAGDTTGSLSGKVEPTDRTAAAADGLTVQTDAITTALDPLEGLAATQASALNVAKSSDALLAEIAANTGSSPRTAMASTGAARVPSINVLVTAADQAQDDSRVTTALLKDLVDTSTDTPRDIARTSDALLVDGVRDTTSLLSELARSSDSLIEDFSTTTGWLLGDVVDALAGANDVARSNASLLQQIVANTAAPRTVPLPQLPQLSGRGVPGTRGGVSIGDASTTVVNNITQQPGQSAESLSSALVVKIDDLLAQRQRELARLAGQVNVSRGA